MATDNLAITELTTNQTGKTITINDGFAKIDGATQGAISPSFTSNVRTLTADEFTGNYAIVVPSLSATGTLTVPLSKRVFAVDNRGNASHDVIVKGPSGTTVDVPALAQMELRNDGTGISTFTPPAPGTTSRHFSYSAGWLPGANPNGGFVALIEETQTVTAVIGNPEVLNGASATVSVVRVPSGTLLSAGTLLHSGSFNANVSAGTNQTLTLSGTPVLSPGDRIGFQSTGSFTASQGGITILTST